MPAANPPFGAVTIDVPPELVDSFICHQLRTTGHAASAYLL
jgi:hypothetical protein